MKKIEKTSDSKLTEENDSKNIDNDSTKDTIHQLEIINAKNKAYNAIRKQFEIVFEILHALPQSVALDIIERDLHRIRQKKIFSEVSGELVSPFEIFYEKFLTNEAIYNSKPKLQRKLPSDTTLPKKNIPIKLEASQTQIVYLFKNLIEERLIKENLNPNLWKLISTYFTDKDGNPLKNIHQTKFNLENNKSGKPKSMSENIENIVNKVKNSE